jgi:hypothetical protein
MSRRGSGSGRWRFLLLRARAQERDRRQDGNKSHKSGFHRN